MYRNISHNSQFYKCELHKNSNQDPLLRELSPKDKKLDQLKSHSDTLASMLLKASDYHSWGRRMVNCALVLFFNMIPPTIPDDKYTLKLALVYWCHLRHCPFCSKRRSMMYIAKFLQVLPKITTEHPKGRWVFLTLTIPNVSITELRSNLKLMSQAWQRFLKRREFKLVKGWIRSTEVTKEKKRKGYAHPHFHCLLFVPPSWFTHSYTNQFRWTQIWQECMRLDEKPILDIRTVKGGINKAILETVKAFSYSVKPEELVEDQDWSFEYFKQVEHLRFFAAGGVLKSALKEIEKETDEDFLHFGDEPSDIDLEKAKKAAFDWRREEQKYRRWRDGDKLYDDYKHTRKIKR